MVDEGHISSQSFLGRVNEWQLLEADITVQNQSIGEQSHDQSEMIRISSGFGQADPKLGSHCSSTRPSALDRRTQARCGNQQRVRAILRN